MAGVGEPRHEFGIYDTTRPQYPKMGIYFTDATLPQGTLPAVGIAGPKKGQTVYTNTDNGFLPSDGVNYIEPENTAGVNGWRQKDQA